MNLIFVGASRFGLRCLDLAAGISSVQVVGVVTAPPVFSISYRPAGVSNVLHADISSYAHANEIPVVMLHKHMNEPGLLDTARRWQPNAFIVAGWYHMIPKTWRDIAPAYGLHASLLPDYSGGAPLVWAMINGETKTGITLFQMDAGVDSGPIAGQKEEPIHSDDTIATLYARIEQRGLELLHESLPQLAMGTLMLQPQDESKRRIVSQRSPDDGLIDWNKDATYIDRFIRAQTHPYPGAFSTLDGKPLHVWRASVVHDANACGKTGLVQRTGTDTYIVRCGTDAIQLKEVSYEQKNYGPPQLARFLGQGGQRLGAPPSCLMRSKHT